MLFFLLPHSCYFVVWVTKNTSTADYHSIQHICPPGGAKLVSCPGRHLNSARPCEHRHGSDVTCCNNRSTKNISRQNPRRGSHHGRIQQHETTWRIANQLRFICCKKSNVAIRKLSEQHRKNASLGTLAKPRRKCTSWGQISSSEGSACPSTHKWSTVLIICDKSATGHLATSAMQDKAPNSIQQFAICFTQGQQVIATAWPHSGHALVRAFKCSLVLCLNNKTSVDVDLEPRSIYLHTENVGVSCTLFSRGSEIHVSSSTIEGK